MSTKWVYEFSEGSRDMRELLGGKGANVAEMTRVLGADRVPAGFTITTDACVAYMGGERSFPEGLHEQVAEALDRVALACSPHRDIAVNPAKMLAIALADANPVVWGGSVLAARAARRVAESIRRASGRTAIAGDAEHLLPVIEATPPRNVFDDPFTDEPAELRPVLVILDDGADDAVVRELRGRLVATANEHGVRTETVDADATSEVARYASLLLSGRYAADYLSIGLVSD